MLTAWQQTLTTNATDWWKGSVLAFDSKIMPSSGGAFQDYNGKSVLANNNAWSGGGLTPIRGSDATFQYGVGMDMRYGSYLATAVGAIPSSFFAEDFTVDYWYKQSITTTSMPVYAIVGYPSALVAGTVTNRVLMGSGPPTLVLWNNSSSPVAPGIVNTLGTPVWKHFAVVYKKSTSTTSVYVNGVLQGTFVWSIAAPIGNIQIGISSTLTDGSNIASVERYRLRSTAAYNGPFDVNTIYG